MSKQFVALFVVFLALITFFSPPVSFSQNPGKYTISGYLKDAKTGETLIAANIYIKELYKGTISNEYGFYSITTENGTYTLAASYLGYQTREFAITLDEDIRLNIDMELDAVITKEVVISDKRTDDNVQSTDMGRIELSVEKIKTLPVLFGEVDILKIIQLLPGIQSSGEGNSGFYVRGGGPDQNLILLDEAVVYNPGHLFGFFSVFNSDALKNVLLIKGGMPANYGGRLSSVLDISMKDGNNKKYTAEGGIGLISSRLTLQGPIVKEKSSFMFSGRRTYIDVLTKPIFKNIEDGDFDGNSYQFYDVNTKVNYKFHDKDRLFLSGYFGRDVFTFKSPSDDFSAKIPWGNSTATIRWNHLFSDKIFMNATAVYNDYNFALESRFQDFEFVLRSGVQDYNAMIDFDWFPNIRNSLKFGASYTFHTFTPYSASFQTKEFKAETSSITEKRAHEVSAYALNDFDITDWWKVNIGLRGSFFQQVGPFQQLHYDDLSRPVDTTFFEKGEFIKSYWGLEPRLSMRFKAGNSSSIKAGFAVNDQYIHLVSSSTTSLPTDLWVPSSLSVEPQKSIQYSIGYFRNFKENSYEASVEVYYKQLRNQIEFGESYTPELNIEIEEGFVFGKGYSTGLELFINKKLGDFTGWIGYTLSFTNKKFEELNHGDWFPAKYDRRHDASIVLSYEVSKKWTLGGIWVYGTGQAITIPVGRYLHEGNVITQYTEQNGYRMDPYHRLDVAATYYPQKEKKHLEHSLTISFYNLYNRKNPYFIYYDIEGSIYENNLSVQGKQVSLFPILPSLTWNFKIK